MFLRTVLAMCLVVGVVVVAACPKAGVDKAETATAAPSPPYWMSLKDGKLHRGLDEAPIGLYAAGDVGTASSGRPGAERFQPSGDIEGQGPLGEKSGTAGTLDLAPGPFVPDGQPKPPPP